MTTELREALESAVSEAETTNESVESTSTVESTTESSGSEEHTSESVVAETSSDESTAEAKPKTAEQTTETKPVEETAEQKAMHRVDRPPQAWKKEAKGEWAALPLHVRQEVYRREQQVNQVMVEASKNREAVDQLNRAIAPYASRVQVLGGPIRAIEGLLKAETVLATGNRQQTAQAMAQLIRDYNVDIQELDAVLSGQFESQPQQSPDISQIVQQQLQQALAPIYQERQFAQERVQQQAVMTVEEMALDPQYPFFEDVRDDMADVIEMKAKRGVAITLPEAYALAVQMNPETAGQLRQQVAQQSATQQHQQAQRAKVASSSVTGAPASGGSLATTGDGSLRGAIEAAFGNARV